MRLAATLIGTLALIAAACGGEEREYAGYRREPVPAVDAVELPELTTGDPQRLVASPGHLLIVYFGYTNCPDYCPTTMSDLKIARDRLDRPELIEPAMVTIDPTRDAPVLDDYVGSFFDDGLAFATEDPSVLAQAANPFGVTYSVEPNPAAASDPDATEFDVAHSTALYAVNDAGELVLTWQFGISIDELALDLEQLLDEYGPDA